MKASNCSGGITIDWNICGAMNFSSKAGSEKTFLASALSFITTSRGVPAGANRPNQVVAS